MSSGQPTERRRGWSATVARTDFETKAAEGAGAGAVAGGGLGALLAALAASGIAVPGMPMIAMGTLAAALTGRRNRRRLGRSHRRPERICIPEEHARLYDRGIRRGGIVMGVNPRSSEDARYFEREWANCEAEQIYCPPFRGSDAASAMRAD